MALFCSMDDSDVCFSASIRLLISSLVIPFISHSVFPRSQPDPLYSSLSLLLFIYILVAFGFFPNL